MPTINRYTYSNSFLKSLNSNNCLFQPDTHLQSTLIDLLACRKRNKRGCRGGKNLYRKIQVVEAYRPHLQNPTIIRRGVTLSNLTEIKTNTLTSVQEHPKRDFPTFVLCNAQSLVNKFDDFELLLHQESVDVGVITESWFRPDMPDYMLSIDGYEIFSKSRSHAKGGGVAVYVKSLITASGIPEISVPNELECVWSLLQPKRLPRDTSIIAVCGVYIPPDSSLQDLLTQHLLESMDLLHTKYPDIGFAIMGDFNRMPVNNILKHCNLKQLVKFPTRALATLDLIMTNFNVHYRDPVPLSALGKSDHVCILWRPKVHVIKNQGSKRTFRPMKDTELREFGRWIQEQDWSNVLKAENTQRKADALYESLHGAVDRFFPMQTIITQSSSKPWMSQKVQSLVKKRQVAFGSGRVEVYNKLRNEVRREIKKAKVHFYANRVRILQETNPRKWHQQIKTMSGNTKAVLRIPVQGVSDDDHVTIANTINDQFVKVSSHIPPLDLNVLEAYLPAMEPPPSLYPWEVYTELKKVKSNKATGPDGISPKLVKEFAYELSSPLTDVLNCSYKEGVVPKQWKKAIVVPIPKTNPPTADKLRPVSLTDCFAKIGEGFVTNWVLDDIQDKIDPQQFGNVKGISTYHYLVSLLHSLHQSADKVDNIGTVVLTDFSKAFDMIDHTILIEKFIRLGVRRSIVPWLCDFVSNRAQCVRYNQALSEYKVLSGALPQGTKLGPIGFQVVINDAAHDLGEKIKCWKYVDDLTFAENRSCFQPSGLQVVLDEFTEWTNTNKLSLNPSKCQAIQTCFKTKPPPHAELSIAGVPLNFVSEAKVLGVWLQNDLRWDKNINEISKKANQKLYMLRLLKRFGFNDVELITIYKSYVRPAVEYADVTWSSSITAAQEKTLEHLQKRACRTILAQRYTSYADAMQLCGLESLADRRVKHCLSLAEGLAKSERTYDLLPPTRRESHARNLRNAHHYSHLRTRTSRFKNSPIPYFISLLNK